MESWCPMEDVALDPRRHAYRPEVADCRLRSRVQAERYATGAPARCRVHSTSIRAAPDQVAEQTSQLLWGETITVYDRADGWCWGQCDHDGYVGYALAADLSDDIEAPTHRISALAAYLLDEPSPKGRPLAMLPMNARVPVGGEYRGYRAVGSNGWILATHLMRFDDFEPDPVATAMRFVGVPYLWGGRTSLAVDCSSLVQLALQASGIFAPRDTYMQAAELGDEIEMPIDPLQIRRGDLVFFPEHVGFADGNGGLLHASGFEGMVSIHRLEEVIEREHHLRGNAISAVRRLPAY